MSDGTGRFWRSVGAVLSGAAVAQAIPLLGSLLLARIFLPADFGVFAAWIGMAQLAAVVVTGRYENALALEPDGPRRRIGAAATVVLTAAGGLLILLICAAIAALAPGWADGAGPLLLLAFGPTAALIAAGYVWQCWAAAEGRFAELSAMRVAQAAGVTGVQIVIGLFAPSAEVLGLGHAAGVFLGLVVAVWRLPIGSLPAARAMRAFWSRQRRFPLLSLPADAVNTAAGQLPLMIVAHRFGADVAGLLALTMRTLGAPIALLGASVLDVFKRRAAANYRAQGNCRDDYLQTLKVLSLAALAVSVVVLSFGPSLFSLAFGYQWRESGVIAMWLMPMFALRFVASPLSYVFYVARQQHVDLVWQVVLLAMTLAALLLPADHQAALQAYSAGYSAMYAIYLVLSYRFSAGATR